jgi:hypothetical protein
MNAYEMLQESIMDLVATSRHQRIRPIDAIRTLKRRHDVSTFAINDALEDLVREGKLVYSYRDPCSYVEIPCNGCDGGHQAARPMRVVTDAHGNRWLCDVDVDGSDYLPGASCWECGDLSFTRSG